MGMFTAIPETTFNELQTDAGVVILGDLEKLKKDEWKTKILCATTGGITVSCVPTFSDLGEDIDNCPNNTMELKHLDTWECSMSFTALGVSAEDIQVALGCADSSKLQVGEVSTTDGHTKITPRKSINHGESESTGDFHTISWCGDRSDGGMVGVVMKNALSTSGFSLKTEKNGKGQVTVEITGHYSIKAQDEVPMTFYSMNEKDLETMGGQNPLE